MSIGSDVLMISVTGWPVSSELPKSPCTIPEIQFQYCWNYEPVIPSWSCASSSCSGVAVVSPAKKRSRMSARQQPHHDEDAIETATRVAKSDRLGGRRSDHGFGSVTVSRDGPGPPLGIVAS